jgi:Ca2+-binding RTX toxin-like protein
LPASPTTSEGGGDGEFNGEIGGDIAYGGLGDDELYADAKTTIADAYTQAMSGASSGVKGEFLSGGPGEDWVVGSPNNDYLDGGSGKDLLIGGLGDDNISGDYGYAPVRPDNHREIIQSASTLYNLIFDSGMQSSIRARKMWTTGGSCNDWVYANGGDDMSMPVRMTTAFGEAGADTSSAKTATTSSLVTIRTPTETEGRLRGGSARQAVATADDTSMAGQMTTKSLAMPALTSWRRRQRHPGNRPGLVFGDDEGADYLDGGEGDDELFANGGNDYLVGEDGNDELYGGDGDDTLIGSEDADVLAGGNGQDTYVFNRGDGTDTLLDPDTAADSLEASLLVLG